MGYTRWISRIFLPACLGIWLAMSGGGAAAQGGAPGHGRDGSVFLYFADPASGYLVGESRKIDTRGEHEDIAAFCTRLIDALIRGPKAGLAVTLPRQTELLGIYTGPRGVVYVDLSVKVGDLHPKGVRSELLSVYSIVNTLMLNSSGIQAVQILINGRQAETLAGHVDIGLPLNAQMLLIR